MAGALTAMIAAAFSGVTPDPYFEYTTLLLPGNGTNLKNNNEFLDSSANAFPITRNPLTGPNAPTQGTFSPFSQTGWGNYFDGTGDYLSTNTTNAAWQLGTGDFEIGFWIYPANVTGNKDIFTQRNASGTPQIFLVNNVLRYNNALVAGILDATISVAANTWTYCVLSRVSGTTRWFVNGASAGSVADTNNWSSTNSWWVSSSSQAFNGYISNLRLIKGSGVTSVTVPTSPFTDVSGTSFLTCQSNRFIDNSSNSFAITPNADAKVVAFSPFNPTASWSAATYGGSGYFDGNADYLSAGSNSAFSFGTSSYTVELWVYPSSISQQVYVVNDTTNGSVFYFETTGSAGFTIAPRGGSPIITGGYSSLITNSWNHVVFVRGSTAANQTSIFVNGTRVANGTDSTNWTITGPCLIGGLTNNTYMLSGYLSNTRIVKGSAVYDPTLTTLTVPTAPLTAITNTSLLLNFTNAGVYDATSKNDLETVGNAQISTAQYKFPPSSMAFDGNGDYLNSPSMPMYSLGTGDFTIEFWAYWAGGSFPNYATALDTRNASLANGLGIATNITNGYWYVSIAGQEILSSTPPSATWQHIAVTRQGTSLKLFINGTQGGSTYTSSNNFSNTTVRVGARGDLVHGSWNGYLQDVRITNGYARYTSNFTPPTAAFPTL